MKAKRVLAAVLCAAMIFSTEGFSMGVNAAPVAEAEGTALPGETETPDPGNASAEDTSENGEKGEDASEAPESPKVTEEPDQTQEPLETQEPSEMQTPEETQTPEGSETPLETATPEETPGDDSTPEASQTPSAIPGESTDPEASATPSAIPGGSMEPDVSATPSLSPEASMTPDADETPTASVSPTASASPALGADSLLETYNLRAANFFEVDENGELKIRDGEKIIYSTVEIPDEAKIIPAGIFSDNSFVTKVKFTENSQLTTINAGAFEGSAITTIELPEGVTEISDSAFKRSALKSITFKGRITKIGKEAFMGTPLTGISIPDVTVIDTSAFANCTALTSVETEKLETIGSYAFENCVRLAGGMIFSESLTHISRGAFHGCGFDKLNLLGINRDGSNYVDIDAGAFENCRSLTTVKLPRNLKTISASLFKGCEKLVDVTIPEETTKIMGSAFGGCISLRRIVLPKGVSQIESKAFDGCSALQEIIIHFQYRQDMSDADIEIAENAFPVTSNPKEIKMKGYDGLVLEYAEKKGYSFETLFEKYTIMHVAQEHAKLTASVGEAVPGTEVQFKITPEEGYSLDKGSISVRGENSGSCAVEFIKTEESTHIFSFVMPKDKAIINYEVAETQKIVSGNLSYFIDPVSGQNVNQDPDDENLYYMEKTGQQAQLTVKDDQKKEVGQWLLTYKSSNTKAVTVSDTGILRACGEGTATISATLKSDTKKKISFKITVKKDAVISALDLEFASPYRAKLKTETIDGVDYQVVEYNKTTLSTKNMTFKVNLKAYEEEDSKKNLIISSEWSSVDKNIAAVSKEKSTDNTNTITVKKGAEGETMITVSVTNKDSKEPVTISFIVRVADVNPRLAESKVSVNSLSSVGTAIDVVPVYGYTIEEDGSLEIRKKTTKNGIVDYDQTYDGLSVYYDNDSETYRILADNDVLKLSAGKSCTFKGSSQLYLWGRLKETGASFVVPIPELTITNKALNPTVKLSGKINLFYNSTASAKEQGSVTLTQSLKNETVDHYELVSEANYKKKGSEAVDSFANNFEIEAVDNEKAVITRTANDMMQVNKKNVVSGYVYIYYKGYTEPVKKKITVSTRNTAPAYVLSATSATASVHKNNWSIDLQLKDKKNKKNIISLANLDEISFDYNSTTDGLFRDPVAEDIEYARENDVIKLQVDGTPRKGKVKINVSMSTWSNSLSYTFNLKTTGSLPTAKLSPSTVTLNTICKSKEGVIKATLNQKDARMAGFDKDSVVYTGNKKYAGFAEALIENMTFDEDTITVKLPADTDVKAMTYSFKVRPFAKYEEDATEDDQALLKAVTFKVTVKSKQPVIKLKSSTFTLNANYPGKETATTTYSVSNLPEGSTAVLDDSEVKLTVASKNGLAASRVLKDGKISFDSDAKEISVTLDESKKFYSAFSYDYYVEGLKLTLDGDESVTLGKFKIKVKGTDATPSVKKTASKGTLNPVDATSSIVYTTKVSGISGGISAVEVWELDPKGRYYVDENGKRTSKHFTAELDDKGKTVLKAKADGDDPLNAKLSYKIKLVYTLEVTGEKLEDNPINLTIKPKQTLPKIKTNTSSAYLYAGQNRDKTVNVAITKTSLTGAEIVGVDFAKGTSSTIKKAFKISYNEATDVMTLRLVNPSLLVMNKKQTITFETKCKNQMANTTGTKFKLTVTVRR